MIPTKVFHSIACCVAILSCSCNPVEHKDATTAKMVNVDSLISDAYQKGCNDEYKRWKKWQQDKVHEVSIIVMSASINNKRNCCDLASHILNEYNRALNVYYKIPALSK